MNARPRAVFSAEADALVREVAGLVQPPVEELTGELRRLRDELVREARER